MGGSGGDCARFCAGAGRGARRGPRQLVCPSRRPPRQPPHPSSAAPVRDPAPAARHCACLRPASGRRGAGTGQWLSAGCRLGAGAGTAASPGRRGLCPRADRRALWPADSPGRDPLPSRPGPAGGRDRRPSDAHPAAHPRPGSQRQRWRADAPAPRCQRQSTTATACPATSGAFAVSPHRPSVAPARPPDTGPTLDKRAPPAGLRPGPIERPVGYSGVP